ncbi:MAG: nickel-dependent lactate racemase [Bacteroidales bacterium]|nr:nickel-dependent lactate racemase [Bacteroidales bacterium]
MSLLIELPVGRSLWSIAVPQDTLVTFRRPEPAVASPVAPAELVRAALECPRGLEVPLRRALTPDDHITIVLDEQLPCIAEMLAAILDHLGTAGIAPSAVTVVVPPDGGNASWIEELPDDYADIRLETHDPEDQPKLAYLSMTRSGLRVYLNRSVVEADFLIVLSGRGYDPSLGHGGGPGALFPVLSSGEIRAGFVGHFATKAPRKGTRAAAEAHEVAWMLGTPLLVQVIAGPGDTIAEIVCGMPDSAAEGDARQDARWRGFVEQQPELVIATISGDPARVTFDMLALAAAAAARVVQVGGRIAILTEAAPPIGRRRRDSLPARRPCRCRSDDEEAEAG